MRNEARLASLNFRNLAMDAGGKFVQQNAISPAFDLVQAPQVRWKTISEGPPPSLLQPMSVVRKCLLILIGQLMALEFLFLVIFIVGTQFFPDTFLATSTMATGVGIKALILVYLVVRWKACYYLITPEKIIQHCGVFYRRQEACAIKNIESIILRQSLLGKICSFGTLKLYAPTLNHRIFMKSIHNPRKKMRLIEKLTPKTQTQNLHKDDMVILPQQAA